MKQAKAFSLVLAVLFNYFVCDHQSNPTYLLVKFGNVLLDLVEPAPQVVLVNSPLQLYNLALQGLNIVSELARPSHVVFDFLGCLLTLKTDIVSY